MNAAGNTAEARCGSEAQKIASILAGNTHEFHELIRPYERGAYVMALSLLKNEADAEDAAQEAFLKAYRGLRSFRAEAKFSTWLMSIVLNEARNRLRRKNAMPMESLDDPPEGETRVSPALLRDWREIPSEMLERMEMRAILRDAVAALSPIYREIVLLRDVEEMSVGESAEVLGISQAAVKVRLHRARLMLQKRLAPQLKQMSPKRGWFRWL